MIVYNVCLLFKIITTTVADLSVSPVNFSFICFKALFLKTFKI